MRRLLIIIAIGTAVCLFSCKSRQALVSVDANSSISHTDTAKLTYDTETRNSTSFDSAKTAAAYEGNCAIEFVDGGGTLSVDSSGTVTVDGIKSIKGDRKGHVERQRSLNRQSVDNIARLEQADGVRTEETKQARQTGESAPDRKWYETTFMRIGQGVCIAALLWLLFIYLKRKK